MNPGGQPGLAAERRATSLIASWSSSWETEVHGGKSWTCGLGPGDGAAAVELPEGQGEDQDVGGPYLSGRDQQRAAAGVPSGDQGMHQ